MYDYSTVITQRNKHKNLFNEGVLSSILMNFLLLQILIIERYIARCRCRIIGMIRSEEGGGLATNPE